MASKTNQHGSATEGNGADVHGQSTRMYSDQTRDRVTKNNEAEPKKEKARPQHHLAGIYLDDIFRKLIEAVGASEAPLETMMSMIVDLPLDIQRDMLCGCLREVRKLIQSTAVKEIGEKAYSTRPPSN